MINTDRLEDLMRAIRLLRKFAINDREWANGIFGQYSHQFREKNLKRAARKERGAARLCKTLVKECDRLKAHYQ